MFLTKSELEVLRVFERHPEGASLNSVELAQQTGLHVQRVRGAVAELRRKHLIEPTWRESLRAGHYRVTEPGRDELVARRQLRLVV